MIDQEFSAALAIYGKAQRTWEEERTRRVWRQWEGQDYSAEFPSVADRFLTACDSPRAAELLARIGDLLDEANRVPDPGGPIGGYIEAISDWAESHPEIEHSSLEWLTHDLVKAHR